MTNCPHLLQLMYDKIDGILNRHSEEQLQDHLERCEQCARRYEHVLAIHLLYSRQQLTDPPRDFAARILSEITNRPPITRPALMDIYAGNGSFPTHATIASILIILFWYFSGFKPLGNAFPFTWQIPSIGLSFLGSLSLPDISNVICGFATWAAQPVAELAGSFGASLHPNLPVILAALVLLQAAGNTLLFSNSTILNGDQK